MNIFIKLPDILIYAEVVPLKDELNLIGVIVSIYDIVDVAEKHNIPINIICI